MINRFALHAPAVAGIALVLAACNSDASSPQAVDSRGSPEAAAVTFPANLAAFGDGYPANGNPCRRLGESDATREWLDDSADLVGCPNDEAAAALNGRVLATVEGITVLSVPRSAAPEGPGVGSNDALVAGTQFNATAQVRCGMDSGTPTQMCSAGVRRRAGPNGISFVEVTLPNGQVRILSFQGSDAQSADGSEADGSAAYTFRATRNGDETAVSFGPERYVIPDALVEGG